MRWRKEQRYRRLPGRYITLLTRASLWLGEDHLLSVNSNRLSEDYRRYYFRDIQAFTIQRTRALSFWVYGIGGVAAAFLAPGLVLDIHKTALWITGGVFLAITLYLIARGATCECYIQTAVSRDRLRSLHWVQTAQKALAIVRPFIEQAQGTLTTEMMVLPPELPVAAGPPSAPPPLPTKKMPDSGWFHAAFFLLLLLGAGLSYLDVFHKSPVWKVATVLLFVAELACIITLLIRQRRFEVPLGVRTLLIVALIVTTGVTYLGTVLATFERQKRRDLTLGAVFVDSYPGYLPLHVTSAAADIILAGAGFVMIGRYRRSLRRLPSLIAPD